MQPGHDLGRRLREARETRGSTIADIAATTKISSRALAAIEREAFDELPHGIFRRAWVRAFAAAVGLDGDLLVRAYVARFEPPPVEPPAPPRWGASPQARLMGGVLALAGLLLAAAAVLSLRREGSDDAPMEAADTNPVAVRPARSLDPPAPVDPAAVASPDQAGRVRLRLETTGPSWISATADGNRVVHRLVGAGEVLVVDAESSIALRAGDAGAVSYSIDGRAPRVLGARGQPLTVYFTAGDGTPAAAPPPVNEAV